MKIKGKNYDERSQFQLDEWVKGNPIHNDVENECCPDFSCCKPEFLQPLEVRETFKAVHNNGDEDAEMGMLASFLGGAMSTAFPDKEIHIAGVDAICKKDLN